MVCDPNDGSSRPALRVYELLAVGATAEEFNPEVSREVAIE